jgi:hypothetical protein
MVTLNPAKTQPRRLASAATLFSGKTSLYSTIAVLALGAILATQAAEARIYKWVDETGQVHYGEQPESQDAEQMKLRIREPAPRAAAGTANDGSKPATDPNAAEPNAAEPKAAQPEAKPEGPSPAEQRRRCAEAKDRLASIMTRPRLKGVDEKGNVYALTDKERDQRIAQYRKQVRDNCR